MSAVGLVLNQDQLSPRRITEADRQIGRRITAFRTARHISQTSLGAAIGVSFQQIQKYEKGLNRISAARLTAIAQILGVSLTNLLGADGKPQHPGVEVLVTLPGALELLHLYAAMSPRRRRMLLDRLSLEMGREQGSASP